MNEEKYKIRVDNNLFNIAGVVQVVNFLSINESKTEEIFQQICLFQLRSPTQVSPLSLLQYNISISFSGRFLLSKSLQFIVLSGRVWICLYSYPLSFLCALRFIHFILKYYTILWRILFLE